MVYIPRARLMLFQRLYMSLQFYVATTNKIALCSLTTLDETDIYITRTLEMDIRISYIPLTY